MGKLLKSTKLKVFLLYLIISAVVTYPLVFHLNRILIGWPLDAFNYMWNIDTFWKQVLSLQNPFFTSRIFFPLGTYLIFHTYAPMVSLFGVFFLKNLPLYLNLLVLLSTAFSAYCAYLLVNKITKNKIASLLGGAIFGFSPIMISFLVSQHYYFAFAAPALPLGIYFLMNFFETGRIKYFVILALVFWATLGVDYYTTIIYLMLLLSFSIIYIPLNANAILKNFHGKLIGISLAFLLTLIIPLLIIYIILKDGGFINSFVGVKSSYPAICSATIKRFLMPSEFNPLLNKFSSVVNLDTPSVFLGLLTPTLAIVSIFLFSIKRIIPFLITGIIFALFSIGPATKIFDFISGIPPLGLIDCPQRFVIGIELPLSVLAGIAISKIANVRFGKIYTFILAAGILIEYATFGLPFSQVEIPQIYKTLSKISLQKTVLELPSGIAESKGAFGYDWSIQGLLLKQMYWQTISGKPRVGGYTSRLDKAYYTFFENEPVISDLFKMTSSGGVWDGKNFSGAQINSFVNKFNLGFIILSPNGRQNNFVSVVEKIFKDRIVDKTASEGFILYKLN